MKNKFKDFFKENGYAAMIYGCVALVVVLAACVALLDHSATKGLQKTAQNEVYEQADELNLPEREQPVNNSGDKSYKEQTTETAANQTHEDTSAKPAQKTAENSDGKAPSKANSGSTAALFAFDENSQDMLMPVQGQIVMDYSPEVAVFDATLQQYRTNDTICIAADVGTEVAASADGVVYDEGFDEIKGNFVVLDHGNGWMSTYSQLGENLGVAVGDIVNMGDTIGKIAEPTAFQSQLGPHVEFYLTHNDEATDPKLLFALEE